MVAAVIPTTITGLQGRPIATGGPTVNQALTWNGSAWAPAGPLASLPVGIAQGGTGATSAAAGLAALGGAPLNRASTPTIIVGGQAPFSATSTIMGGYGNNGWVITPVATGTILFSAFTYANNSNASSANYIALRFGTGTPPAQNAGGAGNTLGSQAFVPGTANQSFPCTLVGIATGLVIGTRYWFDIGLQVNSGTMLITTPTGLAVEI